MISIREMKASDYQAISKIYQQGIDSNLCTFETCVPSWEDFNRTHLEKPRLVAVDETSTSLWIYHFKPYEFTTMLSRGR